MQKTKDKVIAVVMTATMPCRANKGHPGHQVNRACLPTGATISHPWATTDQESLTQFALQENQGKQVTHAIQEVEAHIFDIQLRSCFLPALLSGFLAKYICYRFRVSATKTLYGDTDFHGWARIRA